MPAALNDRTVEDIIQCALRPFSKLMTFADALDNVSKYENTNWM